MIARRGDRRAVRAELQRRDRHGRGIGLGNRDLLGLAQEDRPVLAGRAAVVLGPLGDPALDGRDLLGGSGSCL